MLDENPLITTVIPTYRRPNLLQRAIKSALAQHGVSSQVCVYDNASGDTTGEIVQAMARDDPRVKYFCHPENIGGFSNFQHALARVDTPLFSLLSDDDVLLPGFYSKAIADLNHNPSAKLWAGVTIRMSEAGQVYDAHVEQWPREGLYSGMDGLTHMASGHAPVWTGVLINSEVLSTVGPLDPAVGSASDLDWLLRITARYPFIISSQPVALLTLHMNSFSENAPFSSIWPGWLKMIENVTAVDTLSSHEHDILANMLHRFGKKLTFRHAADALSKGNHPYVNEAARTQQEFFNDRYSSLLLRSLNQLCTGSSTFQNAYSWLYKSIVTLALARRRDLQKRYGHLVRYLATDSE